MNLALGTHVIYTECAAVARKGDRQMYNRGWHIPQRNNAQAPYPVVFRGVAEETDEFATAGGLLGPTVVRFVMADGSEIPSSMLEKLNKATVAWGEQGSGVVCGLETKMHGISYRGDADEGGGYLTHFGQIKLYVVRSRLEGREFVYVPTWAIQPVPA